MDYRNIYRSQIFEQSQCIWHENAMVDFMRSLLAQLDYQAIDERQFIWTRDSCKVYLAIVDDLEQLNLDQHGDFLGSLSSDCVIITDNWFNRPLAADVLSLPTSWFGIYANRPYVEQWAPSKKWCMPVNRIDYTRMMIMLEMHTKGYIDQDSLVNFNCARHTDSDNTQDQKNLWQSNWDNLTPFYQTRYLSSYESLCRCMPFSNHDLEFDLMLAESMVHVVLETYVSDHSVALSEKTFRALTMPRPWRLMGGTWAVGQLRSLGFDVLDDIVNHDTDNLRMIEDKIQKFVFSCHDTWTNMEWSAIEKSCMRARDHNQDLLDHYRRCWPKDFARWLPRVIDRLI